MILKILLKPLTMAVSALGGVLAGALFRKVWSAIAHEEKAPESDDLERTWKEVLAAAALQGLIFAVVHAVINRGSTKAVNKLSNPRA